MIRTACSLLILFSVERNEIIAIISSPSHHPRHHHYHHKCHFHYHYTNHSHLITFGCTEQQYLPTFMATYPVFLSLSKFAEWLVSRYYFAWQKLIKTQVALSRFHNCNRDALIPACSVSEYLILDNALPLQKRYGC